MTQIKSQTTNDIQYEYLVKNQTTGNYNTCLSKTKLKIKQSVIDQNGHTCIVEEEMGQRTN